MESCKQLQAYKYTFWISVGLAAFVCPLQMDCYLENCVICESCDAVSLLHPLLPGVFALGVYCLWPVGAIHATAL